MFIFITLFSRIVEVIIDRVGSVKFEIFFSVQMSIDGSSDDEDEETPKKVCFDRL